MWPSVPMRSSSWDPQLQFHFKRGDVVGFPQPEADLTAPGRERHPGEGIHPRTLAPLTKNNLRYHFPARLATKPQAPGSSTTEELEGAAIGPRRGWGHESRRDHRKR